LIGGGAEGAVEEILAVELGGLGKTIQFRNELGDFAVQGLAVGGAVGGVGGLDGELADALHDAAHLVQGAFAGLGEGDAVVGVAAGLIHAANLAGHPVGNCETGGVILGGIDTQAGGQALQGCLQRAGGTVKLTLSGKR